MSAFTVDMYNRATVRVAFPSRKATLRRSWRYIVTVKNAPMPVRTFHRRPYQNQAILLKAGGKAVVVQFESSIECLVASEQIPHCTVGSAPYLC
jgi:hypothetical protein